MKRPVAFFDIDGSIFRSSLLIEVVEALVTEGVFPEEAREAYTEAFTAWQNREGSYEAYISAVVHSYMHHIKGVFYGDLADIGRTVLASQSKRVYRYSRDLIEKLREEGYYLVAISQSPKTVVDIFCESYGFDKVYGRMYELGPQDKFTGEMIDAHLIENKANIVTRVLDREDCTLEGSVALGDTEGDIPLLEMVERPICFNPNAKLYAHAKRMNWSIVIERKDVIYEL